MLVLLVGTLQEVANCMLGDVVLKMCIDTTEGYLLLAFLECLLKVLVEEVCPEGKH